MSPLLLENCPFPLPPLNNYKVKWSICITTLGEDPFLRNDLHLDPLSKNWFLLYYHSHFMGTEMKRQLCQAAESRARNQVLLPWFRIWNYIEGICSINVYNILYIHKIGLLVVDELLIMPQNHNENIRPHGLKLCIPCFCHSPALGLDQGDLLL